MNNQSGILIFLVNALLMTKQNIWTSEQNKIGLFNKAGEDFYADLCAVKNFI
jgi:hypothetical protein